MGIPRHGHRPKGRPASPTYQSWQAMKSRCCCPGDQAYSEYGGRGITVCEKWMRFDGFLDDMGERPDGTTLDRIDNNLGYDPSNCRWATPKRQQRNRRDTVFVTFDGKTYSIADWADILGIKKGTLRDRIVRYKWDTERALTEPVHRRATNLR